MEFQLYLVSLFQGTHCSVSIVTLLPSHCYPTFNWQDSIPMYIFLFNREINNQLSFIIKYFNVGLVNK